MMLVSRSVLACALVVATLAVMLVTVVQERDVPIGPVDDVRLPQYLSPPDSATKRPPGVAVRVVPSSVAFPEARHLATPETEELARRLVSIEVPRVHRKKRPGEDAYEGRPDPGSTRASAAAPTTTTFGHSFLGLDMSHNIYTTPPDPHGAVGPDHVMSVMNISVA